MGARMRAHDWTTSPLGPPAGWPAALRTVVGLMLTSRFPMFVAWGPELTFLYNDGYRPVFGAKHPIALGRPFAEVWADIWPDVGPLVDRALAGEASFHENLPLTMERNGYPEETYFTFSYSPLRDDTGRVMGMFCACTETTQTVLSDRRLRAVEAALRAANARLATEGEHLRALFRQAPGFMCVLRGPEHVFELANDAYHQLIGRQDIIGKPAREALPVLVGQGFYELLDGVYQSGEPFVGYGQPLIIQRDPGGPVETRFVTFVYQPIRDADGQVTGIFVEGSDITEAKRAEEALRDSEERLLVAQRAGQIGTFELRADGSLAVSEEFCRLWGLPPQPVVPLEECVALIHPEDRPRLSTLHPGRVPSNGLGYVEYRIRRPDTGAERWIARRGESVRQGTDDKLRVVGVVYDITERKRVEEELRQRTHDLEIINRTGAAMAAELDLERLVQTVTDGGVALTGAEFGAFFYNVLREDGEAYTLYTLSGVPRQAFAGFPMPRNTAVFGPTFAGEGIVRSDDITKDPRYGRNSPYHGVPKGHLPVRSYLAVPVKSRSGEVLGGLFFGHSKPGVFTERSEATLAPLSAQAAVAIDNVRLFQASHREIAQRAAAEEQLRLLNERLEERVAEEMAVRRQAEAHLQQAQKMEAVGQLTGGVAHDFNNLLQVIGGNLQLLLRDVAGNDRAEQRVRNALSGVSRGAKLAASLLAFARRQPLEPRAVNLGRLLRGLDDMLRRALGEEIAIETVAAGGLWNTMVDPVQVENALLNLAINARDAMQGHGTLTIEIGNAWLDDEYAARHGDVQPGQYVVLAVSDTGCGMPPEVVERVFEPFFSTKPEGQGTGLGLSMVYGFVKQSGGHIKIYSEVGQGTTIRLYLPRTHQEEDVTGIVEAGPVRGGSEAVLVVEDDGAVRATVAAMLADLGYRVLQAMDAQSALTILESGAAVDLLFTDVVMPGPLRSPDLARKARERLPHLAVLFTSGYTQNAIVHAGRLDAGVELLSKPYTREALARKVRHVLRNRQQRTAVQDPLATPALVPTPARRDGRDRGLRVLLVEDDALIRLTTAEMLASLGHTVVEAGDAEEALSVIDGQPVDALVTDITLPGLSGDQLACTMRRRCPGLPVVLASGYDLSTGGTTPGAIPDAIHLAKPYDVTALAEALRVAIDAGPHVLPGGPRRFPD